MEELPEPKLIRPKEKLRGKVHANAYLLVDMVIDAPLSINQTNASKFLITHSHCDHISGLSGLSGEVYLSEKAKENLLSKSESALLCEYIDLGVPSLNQLELRTVKQGDLVGSLKVIETPGHTEDSICFYYELKGWLFSGDTVFPGGFLPRTDLPTSDPASLAETYEKLENLGIKKIFPGHGRPFSAGKEYIKALRRKL